MDKDLTFALQLTDLAEHPTPGVFEINTTSDGHCGIFAQDAAGDKTYVWLTSAQARQVAAFLTTWAASQEAPDGP